jgi:hypothetical protein
MRNYGRKCQETNAMPHASFLEPVFNERRLFHQRRGCSALLLYILFMKLQMHVED